MRCHRRFVVAVESLGSWISRQYTNRIQPAQFFSLFFRFCLVFSFENWCFCVIDIYEMALCVHKRAFSFANWPLYRLLSTSSDDVQSVFSPSFFYSIFMSFVPVLSLGNFCFYLSDSNNLFTRPCRSSRQAAAIFNFCVFELFSFSVTLRLGTRVRESKKKLTLALQMSE